MAYTKTTLTKAVKRKRNRIPRFEKTEEWRMMQADIERGLKPRDALQVLFTKEDMEKYRITNRRTVARYLKKYLTTRKLPYGVKSFQLPNGGFVVMVCGVAD